MQTAAIVGGGAEEPGARLLAFAGRLRSLHARRAAMAAAVRVLLALGGPGIVLAWLLPPFRTALLAGLCGAMALAALAAAWRARRVPDPALLRSADLAAGDVTGDLAVVGDELATWLECRRRSAETEPMARWLASLVAAQVPALAPAALRAAGRRGLGRLRILVPVVLLLLLAWLFAEWLSPPWPGAFGGKPKPELPLPEAGGGGQGRGAGAGASTRPDPAPTEPDGAEGNTPPPPPPPPPPPEPRAEQPPDPVAPEPPAPLLELPEQQRFVVPEFLGDGPTRRARVRAAELAEAGEAAAPTPTPQGTGGALPPPPPPTKATFERAAEAALRARHVPPEEQAMVRRFFEGLREAAK